MRFPCTFTRYVGSIPAGGIELGADEPPTPAAAAMPTDNTLEAILRIDLALNRLAIGYSYTGDGPAIALTADVYQYAEDTNVWYRLTAVPITLTPGALNYIGVVGGQPPMVNQSSSLSFYILVNAGDTPPDGSYLFQVTGDSGVGDPLFGS